MTTIELSAKREREKAMVGEMIALYCRRKHHSGKTLCPQCAALAEYAQQRTQRCPFMETKTFCSSCPVHCYSPEMQEQIRAVMRFSGPRMLFVHPGMALRHLADTLSRRRKQQKAAAGPRSSSPAPQSSGLRAGADVPGPQRPRSG